jgi:AraC-like DNA-binding protein
MQQVKASFFLPEPYMHVVLSHKKDLALRPHKHAFIQLILVTEGVLTITRMNIDYQLQKGHLCIIPSGQMHALRSESGYSQLGIDLTVEKDNRGIVSMVENRVQDFTILDQSDSLPMIEQLEQSYNQFSVFSQLKAACILDSFLLTCMEAIDTSDSFRSKMLFCLNHHLSANLTLKEISRQMAFSSSHLQRMTNKEFGCSVQELYHRLKLTKACSLLHNTNLSIQHISDSLGFYDQAHFSRFFKQRMKMAPLEYKKTNEMG